MCLTHTAIRKFGFPLPLSLLKDIILLGMYSTANTITAEESESERMKKNKYINNQEIDVLFYFQHSYPALHDNYLIAFTRPKNNSNKISNLKSKFFYRLRLAPIKCNIMA